MLTCVPQSLCSWNYRVLETTSGSALLNLGSLGAPASIVDGDVVYTVRKQNWLTSHWTLERDGKIFAEADKPSALGRTIEIQADSLFLSIVPKSMMGRAVDLKISNKIVGSIEPMHPMTRRATIDCTSEVPELIQLFSFWVTAVMWRRAASD